VAVEDERRAVRRADLRDGDVARLEPALDEAGACSQSFHIGRVVRDQALREHAFVHLAQGSGVALSQISHRTLAI
jgi:hypothetical protein